MSGEYDNIHTFQETEGHVPVIGITESGQDMFLVVAFLGAMNYKRDQSELVAKHLEAAAEMVRNQQ